MSPGARRTLTLVAFALAVRLAVLAATLATAPATLDQVAALHDGAEYLQRAAELGSSTALPAAARRLGPGYPLLIRTASPLLGPPLAALTLAMLGAAAATALLHRLGASPWAAALFAVLTPSWVAFSSTAMSEGPFLAFALAGLWAWRRDRDLAAGLLFGAATLVRPVGAVLFAALWMTGRRPGGRAPSQAAAEPRRSGSGGLGWLVAPLAWALLPAAWTLWEATRGAGALSSVATYVRRDLDWPLASLLSGFAAPLADPLKVLQNLFVLAITASAGWLLWRHRRHRWLAWLASQALFYLLLPSSWVFECLARFLVTGLPAVACAADLVWPADLGRPTGRLGRGLFLVLLTLASAAVSLYWNLSALGALGALGAL